jgi:hypothetical protein
MSPNELAAFVVLRERTFTEAELALKIAANIVDTDRAVRRLVKRGYAELDTARVVKITDAGRVRLGGVRV